MILVEKVSRWDGNSPKHPSLAENVHKTDRDPVRMLGYINGRSVRLPTVTVRTGAPSSAASSFISGLIREPLMGQPSICPIANSSSDAVIDGMPIYITSSKTVVENIVRAMGLDEKVLLDVGGKGVGRLRTVNLPGFRITTRDILNAL